MAKFKLIPINQLIPPPLPVRFAMDEEKLQELVDSMRVHGILQNLVVVPADPASTPKDAEPMSNDGRSAATIGSVFEIVAGHRRYVAAEQAGIIDIPCLVFDSIALAKEAAMLDENLCREDITAAEEAQLYAEMIDKYDLTEDALLAKVHRGANYVYARLGLLKGHKFVFEAVAERKIVLSVAQQLNRVEDADHAAYLLAQAIENGVKFQVVAKWVSDYKAHGPSPKIDLEPFRKAGADGQEYGGPPACFLCGKNTYPSNIVWVPLHDFERDQLLANIQSYAQEPEGSDETVPPR